jgi:hypothetical protein
MIRMTTQMQNLLGKLRQLKSRIKRIKTWKKDMKVIVSVSSRTKNERPTRTQAEALKNSNGDSV